MADDEEEIEQTLFVYREVDVYKLPPLNSQRGQSAGDWREKIFTGRIRITAKGPIATIHIEDAHSGELFVACPVDPEENPVVPVLDSSRYFVLRVADPQGRHAFLGMGFAAREPAFDFNVALQDHKKWIDRKKQAEENPIEETGPLTKFALKDGETISVSIAGKGNSGTKPKPEPAPASDGGFGGLGLLAPPPPAGGGGGSSALAARKAKAAARQAAAAPAAAPAQAPAAQAPAKDAFDFGSFETAVPNPGANPTSGTQSGFDDDWAFN